MKRCSGFHDNEDRFRPTRFSAEGFLGSDDRTPEAIIAEDSAAVAALGTTCTAIAERLSALYDRSEAALGDPVVVAPGIVATHMEARGKIVSPFPGEGAFRKGEVLVEQDGKPPLRLTRLGIHLIAGHCFFQGRGSVYRIEPEDAVRLMR